MNLPMNRNKLRHGGQICGCQVGDMWRRQGGGGGGGGGWG